MEFGKVFWDKENFQFPIDVTKLWIFTFPVGRWCEIEYKRLMDFLQNYHKEYKHDQSLCVCARSRGEETTKVFFFLILICLWKSFVGCRPFPNISISRIYFSLGGTDNCTIALVQYMLTGAYDTWYFQAATHLSTSQTQRCKLDGDHCFNIWS